MIETPRLILRPWMMDDYDDFLRLRTNPEIMRYIKPQGIPTPEQVRERYEKIIAAREKNGFGSCAVVYRKTGRIIGWCGLQPYDNPEEIEIGYAIEKEFWGQGIVSEAAEATLRYGFETLCLDRIVAVAIPENRGSSRVMEKIGMTYEKNTVAYGNECVYYAMSRDEWTALSS